MRVLFAAVVAANLFAIGVAQGEDAPNAAPKPIPQTRPAMKEAIEGLKKRQARLPLPEVTAEEQTAAAQGGRMLVNNGRMRGIYLPKEWMSANPQPSVPQTGSVNSLFTSQQDPAMSLDPTFKVRLFWIVSRSNNCQYCLGHQEHKLHSMGMDEDSIAALDSEWQVFPDDEQAAMEFTRRVTLAPHRLTAAELDKLRSLYTNPQWVELVYTVASYNSTNRWTDSMGIPQDQKFRDDPIKLDGPTSEKYLNRPTLIFANVDMQRPPLESRGDVEAALSTARSRTPRVDVPKEQAARQAIGEDVYAGALPQWIRVLSIFPKVAVGQVKVRTAMENTGKLSPELKAKLAWTSARQNRAWYAAGDAQRRLKKLGLADDAIFALDGDKPGASPAEQQALLFCRKLTATPQQITDADIAGLRKVFSDNEVAEIVQTTCVANMFDRFTEVLNLQLEPS